MSYRRFMLAADLRFPHKPRVQHLRRNTDGFSATRVRYRARCQIGLITNRYNPPTVSKTFTHRVVFRYRRKRKKQNIIKTVCSALGTIFTCVGVVVIYLRLKKEYFILSVNMKNICIAVNIWVANRKTNLIARISLIMGTV